MVVVKKLKGDRISLGPVSKKYVPNLTKWMNDPEVTQHLTSSALCLTEENEKKWLKDVLENPEYHYYGIFLGDELIGSINLDKVDNINRTATLGIVIGEKKHWGKGHGTEAIRLLLDYSFNVLNLNNIFLTVNADNKRAINCYKKVGFKLIGKRRQSRFIKGKYEDEIHMDILAKEFKK